jgi:hypothetical protein
MDIIEMIFETHFSHGLTSVGGLIVVAAIVVVIVTVLIVLAPFAGRKK